MKKVLNLLILGSSVVMANAQKLDDVKAKMEKNDVAGAKADMDKILTDSKQAAKAETWFFKGMVYNEAANQDPNCKNCRVDAFEAFKKYQQLDAKNFYMIADQNARLFDLYNKFFAEGAKGNEEKNYAVAATGFKNALAVSEYISSKDFEYNGFKYPKFDTTLIGYVAYFTRMAGNTQEAIGYYNKLVKIGLRSDNDKEMYQYLLGEHDLAGNKAAYDDILAKYKTYYPGDTYWLERELNKVDKKDKPALLAKYEAMLPSVGPDYNFNYNYCAELFNYVFSGSSRPADYAAALTKLKNAINTLKGIKNTGDVNLLMGKTIFNQAYEVQDEMNTLLKSKKPEDVKKAAAKKIEMMSLADACIQACEVAIPLFLENQALTKGDKANLKSAYSLMDSMYEVKGNKAKSLEARANSEKYR